MRRGFALANGRATSTVVHGAHICPQLTLKGVCLSGGHRCFCKCLAMLIPRLITCVWWCAEQSPPVQLASTCFLHTTRCWCAGRSLIRSGRGQIASVLILIGHVRRYAMTASLLTTACASGCLVIRAFRQSHKKNDQLVGRPEQVHEGKHCPPQREDFMMLK